ncbi:hypothetical protein QBZ16_002632 [Prototheca wickerhamii]|uniref:K Homology domain-containing protein n=1 Tax=Prototheca wickerhamii TaxID=3111 RepID=A0AAD9IMX9_PROWI|nr:hypothetical protein QBZ16_002632 [Prototheca wickerhamii]
MAGSSAAKLRITLLAAGFVIGPSGVSVRDITRMTGSNIRSWNEFASVRGKDRKVRTLVIEGPANCVSHAVEVISLAVKRYKDLCEGAYCGCVFGGAPGMYAARNQPHPAAWSSLVGPHSPAMSGSPDGDKENLMFGRPNLLGSQDLTVLANKLLQGQLDTAANARDAVQAGAVAPGQPSGELPDIGVIIQNYQRHLGLQPSPPASRELAQEPCPSGFSLFGPSSGYQGQQLASIFCPPGAGDGLASSRPPSGPQMRFDPSLAAMGRQLAASASASPFGDAYAPDAVIPHLPRAEPPRVGLAL